MDQPIYKHTTNRTMPDCTIIPVLAYTDVVMAIDWLCKTFGCTERWRAGKHRAQLAFGKSAIALSAQDAHLLEVTSVRYSIMVRVADLNSHYEHVQQQGATILATPTDYPYGERQYSVVDIGGHVWTFSQTVANKTPEDWGGISSPSLKVK